MKSLLPKALSPSPNSQPLFLRVFRFSASSSRYDPHSHHGQNPPSRRDDDRSRGVRVSVWWDFENCNLPAGVNVFRVAALIAAAVRASGIRGPIQITAFGDVLQLSRSKQEALSATGINMTHVPHGGKNSADRSLLADLMYWVSQNPPPAHLFLISGDRDFASILHKLRMSNYNILLASPESAPPVLCSAASIMWSWNSLVKGENLTGKHFNQPPDGPYGSWYGHCKLPLEDPFAVTEQPRLGSEILPRPVPQAVMRQIWRLVRSSPKGIPITELRAELGRSNLHLDKDLYGYKKFSQFLMSMPHIIKLHHQGDGQFLVQAVTKKPQYSLNSSVDPSTRSINESGEEVCTSSDADDELMHAKRAAVEKLPPSELNTDLTSDKEPHQTSPDANVAVPPKEVGEQHLIGKKALEMPTGHAASEVANSDADGELMQAKRAAIKKSPPPVPNTDVTSHEAQQWPSPDEHVACASQRDSTSLAGIFKRFWTRWFGVKDSSSNKNNVRMSDCTAPHRSKEMSNGVLEQCSTCSDDSGEVKDEDKCPTQVPEPNYPPSSASTSNQSAQAEEGASRMETYADKCSPLPNDSGTLEEISNRSTKGNIDTLWGDMKSSLNSAKGSPAVSKSRIRREMVQNLRKDRLAATKAPSDSDLLHFVDLLKVGPKSVEEDQSQKLPFKPAEHCSHASSSLSSVFQGNPSLHTELQRPFEHNGEKKLQNSDTGVSPHVINKRPIDRLRDKILADCQKLVNEILKQHPGGYGISPFKQLFLEKYGYRLDPQRLGCEELTSVLEMMAGVTVESNHIYPSGKASKCRKRGKSADPNVHQSDPSCSLGNLDIESCGPSKMENAGPTVHQSDPYGSVGSLDIESCGSSKKDGFVDSPWEELGPVADEISSRDDLKPGRFTKGDAADVDYNPDLSDSDFLELEDETIASGEEVGGTQKEDTVHSSPFEEVINSYYTSKKSDSERNKSNSMDDMSDSSPDTVQPSDPSGGTRGDASFQCSNAKRGPGKSYCFVADPDRKGEGRPFYGILDSLDKSNESRMHG